MAKDAAIVGDKIEKIFAEKERLVEEVLLNRQAMIDFEDKKSSNREGLAALSSGMKQESKAWLCIGDMFMRLPKDDARSTIEKEQVALDGKIDKARKAVQQNTRQLQQLEDQTAASIVR
ncbi:hypothetical protein BC940DRAFT_294906 [Gongronella butleri]|nr:hypothetical protein BC940DRAFT_294906 [Gongronella butleri]